MSLTACAVNNVFEGEVSGQKLQLAFLLIVIGIVVHFVYSWAPIHHGALTLKKEVLRMVSEGFLTTIHAVISSIAASQLLPQEY